MSLEFIKKMEYLDNIEYGWVDKYGVIHRKSGRDFYIANYHLQSPDETLKYKVGTCWDQVELIRYYAKEVGVEVETYIIIYDVDGKIARHTFAVTCENDKFYLLEDSRNGSGIVEYSSLKEILESFITKFPQMYGINNFDKNKIEIYRYDTPKVGLSYDEFTEYVRSCKEVHLKNEE